MLPTADYLHECFDYNAETGVLIWRKRPEYHFKRNKDMRMFHSLFSGKEAGSKNMSGGLVLHMDRKMYWVHRVIYKMMTGKEPDHHIDHVNLDRCDNRWVNLRPATRSQNGGNRPMNRTNPHGLKGVSFWQGKFKAQIGVKGKKIHLGSFDTKEQAHEAYCKAAKEYFKLYSRAA